MSTYDVGDRRKLTCQVKDEAGNPADPDSLVFRMTGPSGGVAEFIYEVDVELVREAEGVFYVYWDCAEPGTHRYVWVASGLVAAAEKGRFHVRY